MNGCVGFLYREGGQFPQREKPHLKFSPKKRRKLPGEQGEKNISSSLEKREEFHGKFSRIKGLRHVLLGENFPLKGTSSGNWSSLGRLRLRTKGECC